MSQETIRVVLEGEAGDLQSALRQSAASIRGLATTAQTQSPRMAAFSAVADQQRRNLQDLTTWAKRASIAVGGLAAVAVGAGVKKGIELNAQWESLNTSFTTLLGNAERAKGFVEELRAVSENSPLRLTEYAEAAQTLLGFGLEAEKVIPLLDSLNTAVVATGKGEEEMSRIVMALGQIEAKGKASAEELHQLADAGLPVNNILRKELNLTRDEVANIGNEGIRSGEVLTALAEGFEKRFGDAFRNANDDFSVQSAEFTKNYEQMLRLMTESLFEEISEEWLPTMNKAADDIIAIWERDGLTPEEKFERSREVIEERFGPLMEDLKQKIEDADLPEKFGEVLEEAIPVVAEGAGKMALIAGKSFLEAFVSTDGLGKLVLAGWLFTKIGGRAGWALLGRQIGGAIGAPVSTTVAGTIAGDFGSAGPAGSAGLPTVLSQRLKAMSPQWRRIGKIGIGVAIGAGIAAALKDAIEGGPIADAISDIGDIAMPLKPGGGKLELDGGGEEAGKQLVEDLHEAIRSGNRKEMRETLDQAREAFDKNLLLGDYYAEAERLARRLARRAGADHREFARSLDDPGAAMEEFLGTSERTTKGAADAFSDMFRKVRRHVRDSGGDVAAFDEVVKGGMSNIGENVNEALKAFNAPKLSFKWTSASGREKALLYKQRGGPINTGAPSGDSVPAMLERDEYVLNREAVKKIGKNTLDAINFGLAPRFQKGGGVGGLNFALGPYDIPPIRYAADHAGGNSHVHITGTSRDWIVGIGRQLQRMGFMVGEHPAFGGVNAQHSPTGGHYDALAIDVNSAADETRAEVAQIARLIGGSGSGGLAPKIARAILTGPDGPLKDLGQGALDEVHKEAVEYVRKQQPRGVAPRGGGAGGAFDKDALRSIWRRAGGPAAAANIAAAVSLAESGGNPDAKNVNTDGSIDRGLWQINSIHGALSTFDPFGNAKAAVKISSGGRNWSPWVTFMKGLHTQFLAEGGIVEKLTGRIKRRDRGVARLRETIDLSERRFRLPKSEMNEEIGPEERQKLIDLNVRLLGRMRTQRGDVAQLTRVLRRRIEGIDDKLTDRKGDVAIAGLDLSNRERERRQRLRQRMKGNRGEFRDQLQEARQALIALVGRTGKGGEIFSVRETLAGLRADARAEGPGQEALNELLRERLRESQATARLSEAQFETFTDFFSDLKLPYLGAFARGTAGRRIGRTGVAMLHEDEIVTPDPRGPFGSQVGAAVAERPIQVNLYADGNLGPLMGRVRAEIDGRAVDVVDRRLGRRKRQLTAAPGRSSW